MSDNSNNSAPTPADLREQVERTREELSGTVEALAAKADVKAQVQQTAARVQAQAQETAEKVKEQFQDKTTRARQMAQEKTPDEVIDKAGQVAEATRTHRGAILAVGAAAALATVILIRRRKR
ncbi:DUF3618 domain-containing protein [Streptomyces sp. NPDC058534]|uniref:DUF3618 domain-containing protein n=1 Tax=Streptomyces sp. NPDC058534 TaxID=3346541 RepID=UPI00365C5D12